MVDFVIINYNTGELTCQCIESIFDTYSRSALINIVDNASADDSVKYISDRYPQLTIIRNEQNYGYAKAVNIGVRTTSSKLVLVSNSDVTFHPDSINIAAQMLKDDAGIGVSGFFQYFPDGRPQRSHGSFPGYKLGLMDMLLLTNIQEQLSGLERKLRLNSNKIKEVEYADGAALMIRREVFDRLNGFDENFFFYTEEADFCKRVKEFGYRVVLNSKAVITHIRGAASGTQKFNERVELMLIRTKIQYILKHGSRIEAGFFKYAESFHFLMISIIERVFSFLKFKNRLKYNNGIYYQIYKLWLRTKID